MSPTVLLLDEIPPSPERDSAWMAELPEARRVQMEAWPDPRARHRSLLGSRLLRAGLTRLGYPADVLCRLRYGDSGKPSLDLPVAFSLSHCRGRLMCAVSSEGPVGADIERIGNVAAADVALYLGTAERDWAGDDPRRLLELWTRKEAIVKAAGERGLRQMPLFEVLQNGTLLNGQRWYTAPIDAGGDYIAHVAGAEVPPRPRIEKITPEMLL